MNRVITSSTAALLLAIFSLPSAAAPPAADPSDTIAAAQIPRPRPRPATAPATQPAEPETQPSAPPEPPLPRVAPERLEQLGFAGRETTRSRIAATDDFIPISDRWRIGFPGGYVQNAGGHILDPYNQNVLKGDYPIIGDDKFLIITATSDTLLETRQLPVPSAVSSLDPRSFDFFGAGEQYFINQNFILVVELFQGDAAYKPRDWEIRFTPVFNINYVRAEELQVIDPDFRQGRHRDDSWLGFQEAYVEKHLGDLSPQYDFWAVRAGIQGFTSDFRGFVFSDNEPGVRFFGSLDNNQTNWNIALFTTLEKDTNSGLNTYTRREQEVFIANIYRQDFLWLGYTAQLSFHANWDNSDSQLDDNGFLVRPAPVGTIRQKSIDAYYLGWAGDGHIGRLNISHQFYHVFGEENFNPIADREVDINAQFFAAELSYDQDWIRYRASFAYASGDGDPTDGTARGFDTIFDNPNFAGGGFSFFTRQAVRLTGSGVGLIQRNSFVPNLRTSKEQGHANFVNPGLLMYNIGADIELTPKWRAILNATYLQFAHTDAIKQILFDNKIARDIGIDYSVGLQYRPYLNNNVIITFGAAALVPGNGFKDIYTSETLYSGFVGITLTY